MGNDHIIYSFFMIFRHTCAYIDNVYDVINIGALHHLVYASTVTKCGSYSPCRSSHATNNYIHHPTLNTHGNCVNIIITSSCCENIIIITIIIACNIY